jgi:hypothetical protein
MYTFRFWSPLLNVKLEGDTVSLTDTLSFRRPTNFEKDHILPELGKRWTHTRLRTGDHVLEVLLRKEQPEPEPDHFTLSAVLTNCGQIDHG